MMRHPERWPNLVLALKHRTRMEADGRMRLLGFMCDSKPIVYIGCTFALGLGLNIGDLGVEKYSDLEAVVAAGWMVD